MVTLFTQVWGISEVGAMLLHQAIQRQRPILETIVQCSMCHMPSTPTQEIHYEACPYHDPARCPTCIGQSPRWSGGSTLVSGRA